MRFASIGSGSEGNGLIVEAGTTRVLIDCGFGVRDTAMRLERLGIAPESLSAILVTHEHNDHVGGVAPVAGRYGIAVWLTFGTLAIVGERRHVAVLLVALVVVLLRPIAKPMANEIPTAPTAAATQRPRRGG